jgi:hypothetical protein
MSSRIPVGKVDAQHSLPQTGLWAKANPPPPMCHLSMSIFGRGVEAFRRRICDRCAMLSYADARAAFAALVIAGRTSSFEDNL